MKKLMLIGLIVLTANSGFAQATNWFFIQRFDVNGTNDVADTKLAIMEYIPPIYANVTNIISETNDVITLDEFEVPVTNQVVTTVTNIVEEIVVETPKKRARRWAHRRTARAISAMTKKWRERNTTPISGVDVITEDDE